MYIDETKKVHAQMVDGLEAEYDRINLDEDHKDKLELMEGKEQVEIQKLEKVIKKEHNEFKNIAEGPTNVKALHSKMNKTLKIMRKLTEENNRIVKERDELQSRIEESKSTISKS